MLLYVCNRAPFLATKVSLLLNGLPCSWIRLAFFVNHQFWLVGLILYVSVNNYGMRGSRNFRQGGGGPGQSDKKALTTFFLLFIS